MSEIFIADAAIAKRMTHLFGKARVFPDATTGKLLGTNLGSFPRNVRKPVSNPFRGPSESDKAEQVFNISPLCVFYMLTR